MIFRWWPSGITTEMRVGSCIKGLIVSGKRPDTVTLTEAELGYLIQDPQYLVNIRHALIPDEE